MPRSAAAYLLDILDACDAIEEVLAVVDLATYLEKRPIRSAVEREFIIIGEAINALSRTRPDVVSGISHAGMIIAFRNVLAHDYASVDDETVYGLAQHDVAELKREAVELLERIGEADSDSGS